MSITGMTLAVAAAAMSASAVKSAPQAIDAVISGVTDAVSSDVEQAAQSTDTDLLTFSKKAMKSVSDAANELKKSSQATAKAASDDVVDSVTGNNLKDEEKLAQSLFNASVTSGNQTADQAKDSLREMFSKNGNGELSDDLAKYINGLSATVTNAGTTLFGKTGHDISNGNEDLYSGAELDSNANASQLNLNPEAYALDAVSQMAVDRILNQSISQSYSAAAGSKLGTVNYLYDPLYGGQTVNAIDGLQTYTDQATGQTGYRRVVRSKNPAKHHVKQSDGSLHYDLYNLDSIT